ncbi:MAG: hypothetical protein H6713_36625 [Myxococcales bacterium]|nr:hypothetical protein [Myxococcales bacterium]
MQIFGHVRAFVEEGLPRAMVMNAEAAHRVGVAVFISVACGVLALAFIPLLLLVAEPRAGLVGSAYCLVISGLFLVTPVLLRRSSSLLVAGNWLTALAFIGFTYAAVYDGGLRSALSVGFVIVVPISLLIAGLRSGIAWGAIVGVTLVSLYALELRGALPGRALEDPRDWLALALAGHLIVITIITWLIIHFERLRVEGMGLAVEVERRMTRATLEEFEARAFARQTDVSHRAKAAFMATMSHELRTPLNAMIGYAEELSEGVVDEEIEPEEQIELLNQIIASGRHLVTMISDVLELSQFDASRFSYELERFELLPFFNELIATLEPLALAKGIELTCELPTDPTHINSDPMQLRRVLTALLSNAIKFTEEGSVRCFLRGVGLAGASGVEISIEDTGIGIPAERLDDIFQPFQQVDGSRSRAFEGAGLGLALAKHITDGLGGSISVASKLGEGSCFTVRLPT